MLNAWKRAESCLQCIVGLPDFACAEPQHPVGELDFDEMSAIEP